MKRYLHFAALSLIVVAFSPPDAVALSPEEIRSGYLQHAAMAQARRWYQYYENPAIGLKNQLDILAPDVSVKSALGEVKGHTAYAERVAKLPQTWKNAHFIRSNSIKLAPDGSSNLRIDITYLNQGMLPDGSVRSAELTYETVLASDGKLLPTFRSIAITQNSDGKADAFRPAYAENRLLSMMHYYLAIIEDPKRDAEPMREVFHPEFRLNFSSGPITTFDGFKAWLAGPGSQIAASTHVIRNFSYRETSPGSYSVSVDFDWEGILPNGKEMAAKTRHSWVVTDDPSERFARLRSVEVQVLEPFALKP